MTTKKLQSLSHKFCKLWQEMEAASSDDSGLKTSGLVNKARDMWKAAHDLVKKRELAEAERKDKREGNPTLWEIFQPDEILGSQIIRRSAHRIFKRRIPTWGDVCAIAFGVASAQDAERYKETVEAERSYSNAQDDFRAHMEMLEYRKSLSSKRMLEKMPAWGRQIFAEAA